MAQINKPTDYFNTVLWTGDATYPRSITGVGFQPDFVWSKNRDVTYSHQTYDSVRGTGTGGGVLYTNATDAVDDTYKLDSFDSDGFTLGSSLSALNASGNDVVAWNWLAGGTASSNTDGSITSSVSANTTSGFSIVSYTGTGSAATVGHGLGVAPKVVIVKNRTTATNWMVGHNSLTDWSRYLELNATSAESSSTSIVWNSTAPTSSVFSIGTAGVVNTSSDNYVAYCFAEKKGFSKFGSYVGNGSTDGPFVYTGFKPAWFLLKRYDSGSSANWEVYDTTRDTYNQAVKRLAPSLSDAEATNFALGDILSNGVKIRQTDQTWNASGGTYIYMAFAKNPLVGTNNIPATAR